MSTVGEIKTEIVYHGDVLNTAARIQSLCKNYHTDLLISENFFYFKEKNSPFKDFLWLAKTEKFLTPSFTSALASMH